MMSAIAITLLNSEQNIKYMIIVIFSTVCEQLHMQKQDKTELYRALRDA